MKLDILIKNGHVIDTCENVNYVKNVGIKDGRITETPETEDNASYVIDARGCYVLPGLIDFHTHVFYGGSEYAVNPEQMLPHGVTAAVDAGSCGYANYKVFHDSIIKRSSLKIKSYINMYPAGIFEYGIEPVYDARSFNEKRMGEMLNKYEDEILGFKIMLSKHIVGELGVQPLMETIEMAERIGNVSVCVHTTDLPCQSSIVADMLRKGDIYCHCYQGDGNPITDDSGRVYDSVRKARERGVLFDAANGRVHFSFKVAEASMRDGFYPDIISTDLVSRAINILNYNRNLPFVMSKYVNMGMKLENVVKAVTETPAKAMGMSGEIGTLKPGAYADVALFEMKEAEVCFCDMKESGRITGNRLLLPRMTILDGNVVYCSTDFNI